MSRALAIEPRGDNNAMEGAQSPSRGSFKIRGFPSEWNPTPIHPEDVPLSPGRNYRPLSAGLRTNADVVPKKVSTMTLEDIEQEFQDIISEEFLKRESGQDNLFKVRSLELRNIDSTEQSLETLGTLLPNLEQLKLTDSLLQSFRDLGTSLNNLKILCIPSAGIRELDGISALSCLRELILPNNKIEDISPLSLHDSIEVLDLEGNRLRDLYQLDQLASCPRLRTMTLKRNPVSQLPSYRQIMAHLVPQLKILDDKALTPEERVKLSEEVLQEAALDDCLQVDYSALDKAAEATQAPPLSPSPSKLRQRGSSFAVASPGSEDKSGTGSTLTYGSDVVFAGNAANALKQRRRSEKEVAKQEEARISIMETLDRAMAMERLPQEDRFREIKAWKEETDALPASLFDFSSPPPASPASPKARLQQKRPEENNEKDTDRGPDGLPTSLSSSLTSSARGSLVGGGGGKEKLRIAEFDKLRAIGMPEPKMMITPREEALSQAKQEEDGHNSDNEGKNKEAGSLSARGAGIQFDLSSGLDEIDRWTRSEGENESDEGITPFNIYRATKHLSSSLSISSSQPTSGDRDVASGVSHESRMEDFLPTPSSSSSPKRKVIASGSPSSITATQSTLKSTAKSPSKPTARSKINQRSTPELAIYK